jgi:hypothetical protein
MYCSIIHTGEENVSLQINLGIVAKKMKQNRVAAINWTTHTRTHMLSLRVI